MSRPQPSAPLQGARRARRRGDALRGLFASLLMTVIALGVPFALVAIIGNPLPHISGTSLLSGRQSSEFVIKVLACVAWLAWAQVAACLLVEMVAGVRGTGMPWRVPFAAAAEQDFARRLVTAVLLLATASHGLQSATAAGAAAAARPAATATQYGGTVQYGPGGAGQQHAATGAPRAERTGAGAGAADPGGAAGAAERGRSAHGTKTYIVMPPQGTHHDSLWGIAERYLGSGIRYKEIYELNKGRLQPDGERLTLESLIYPGWTLVLPADAHGDGLVEVGGPVLTTPTAPRTVPPVVPTHTPAPTTRAGSPAGQTGQLSLPVGPTNITAPPRGTIGGVAGPAPERSPQIPWDLVGAELLAAGLLEVLVGLRRRRSRARYAGGPVARPDADAAGAEAAIRIGADPASALFLDRALRLLAHGLAQVGRSVPEIYAVRVSAAGLEMLLALPDDSPPPPFTVDSGGRWVLPRETTFPDLSGVPALLPGLVSLGGDGRGRVFVDLEAAGGAICVAGDQDTARSVVAAAAVELVTNRWSDDMRVTLVGFGSALAALHPERLRCVDTLAEVLDPVTDRLSKARQAMDAAGVGSVLTGRVRGVPGVATPQFLILANPPDADELAELTGWARSGHDAPLGVLVAGAVEGAQWRFEVGEDNILTTGPLGLRVGAQQLSARSYAAVARLMHAEYVATVDAERQRASLVGGVTAAAGLPLTEPNPPIELAARLAEVPVEPIIPTVPALLDPDTPYGVLVRLFGEPGADGGDSLPPGTPLAVEILSYLALSGPVTPRNLAAAVWPYGVTEAERDASLDRLTAWLGTDATGRARLSTVDGQLTLSPDVRLDWHQFVAHATRGEEADLLRALELARGPLATPHLPRRYTWLARQPVSHELPAYVVDTAHRLAQRYLARGEYDGAAAAARAALRVEPLSELLWDDLVIAVRNRDGERAAEHAVAEKAAALAA